LLAYLLRDPQAGAALAALAGPATWTTHLRAELYTAWKWATAAGGAPGYGVVADAYTRRLLRAPAAAAGDIGWPGGTRATGRAPPRPPPSPHRPPPTPAPPAQPRPAATALAEADAAASQPQPAPAAVARARHAAPGRVPAPWATPLQPPAPVPGRGTPVPRP